MDVERIGWKALAGLACAALWGMGGVASLAAQELPLRRVSDDTGDATCRATPEVLVDAGPEARAQAAELASGADQAVVLGELQRAAALLERATELDPFSAELAYRRGRVLEDLGQSQAARSSYCRVLDTTGPDGARNDARDRMRGLAEGDTNVSGAVRAAADEAVDAAESGYLDQALQTFEEVARNAPLWAHGAYDRGVTLDLMGRNAEAVEALRLYLDLAPSADDAVAVSRRIGQLEVLIAVVERAPNPFTAFALGTLFPGMGQFYSGRARGGLLVMALTAGTLAGGLFITEVNVRCQVPVESGASCPPESVASKRDERPYLWLAVGVAAAVVTIGAVEAFMHTRQLKRGPGPYGATIVTGPSLSSHGTGVDLNLFSVRFR